MTEIATAIEVSQRFVFPMDIESCLGFRRRNEFDALLIVLVQRDGGVLRQFIGVPAHLLAGSLICTMAQRLARKLCSHCRAPREATREECHILGYDDDVPPTIYDPVGCERCKGKGYKGRIALIEILRVESGMDELIASKATRSAMMEYALDNGFIPMAMDGIDKVIAGQIDIQELIGTLDMTDRL